LIRNFYQMPEADLQIVVDQKQERLDHIHERYPEVHATRDLRDLLASDVEAVAIATPVSAHSKLAIACLEAGKHVLVEKPLACSSAEAQAIVDAGRAAGKVVMTGHTFLYNPAVLAVKALIDSGEIGQVYYINSTRVNLGLYQHDVNVVWDLAPHDVSILMYLLGEAPVQASARGGQFAKAGMHDVAYLTLYWKNGVMANCRVSWLDPQKIRRITVVGSKKMIVYDDIEPNDKVKIYDKGVEVQPYSDTLEEFHLAYRYGDVSVHPLDWQEPLRSECLHFLECCREGKKPRSDGEQGVQVIRVLEAAQASLFNGHTKECVE